MTRKEAIAELVRIWHSPHLDLSLKAGLAEAIEALKGEDGDLISRQAALDAIMGEPTDAHYPSWYAQRIKLLPSAEPKIYGNEHNCVLTMFGECSYNISGCGSCEIVDKIREAINAEPKTGRWVWDDKGYFHCDQCGKKPTDQTRVTDFCANCGARMLGEDGEA